MTDGFSVRGYAAVTAAYWGFTLTDGALRMLVLLHFHELGYSPLELATLFLLYEFFGIVTNLFGGWLGARFGLRLTLHSGLFIQIAALVMLSFVDPGWAQGLSVAYVMAAQALSGIAKDLTKMSSKSAVKLVAPKDGGESALFKWVAILTGSKNALKGAGFFMGGALLGLFGFAGGLYAMAAGLSAILIASLLFLPKGMGKTKSKVKFTAVFSKNREINILSAARFFLFASRDVWFVVGLPVFMAEVLNWDFYRIGGFMAVWVIGYGIVQSSTPALYRRPDMAPTGVAARWWAIVLLATPAAIAVALWQDLSPELAVIGGLLAFGLIFAVNSSVHSYLILAYSDHDKVALNVGFYYMANAAGRLGGTIASGLLYQAYGLTGCLIGSAVLIFGAALLSFGLPGRAARQQA